MSDARTKTRSHEHELTIDATPEQVWEAIATAEGLLKWFPLQAEVVPGEGGSITYGWNDLVGTSHVSAWQPGRHLQTGWFEAPTADERRQLLVDWYLEGREGKTVLRLVHSGFGRGSEWDDEYDGTRRGWHFELQGLKHYLEHHLGKARRAFWLRQPTSLPAEEVWRRLTGPRLVRSGSLEGIGVGDRYELELTTGDRLTGTVLVHRAPREFAATAENLDFALVRFGHEQCGGPPEAFLYLTTWGEDEQAAAAREVRWKQALQRAVG